MPKSHAVAQRKRRADGQYEFPDSCAVGISQLGRGQALGFNFDHGNVRLRVGPFDYAVEVRPSLNRTTILSAFSTT